MCVNGEFYCHELSEESGCDNLTLPVEGAACLLEDRYIQPGELTRVRSVEDEDDCEMWYDSCCTYSLSSFHLCFSLQFVWQWSTLLQGCELQTRYIYVFCVLCFMFCRGMV